MALEEIKAMYDEGERQGASHMLVAYDSFDGTDYPIYVKPGHDPKTYKPTNGDDVLECYRYSLGWEVQSKEHRANHWETEDVDPAPVPEPVVEVDARVESVATTLYMQECIASGSSVEECANSWSDLSGGSRGRFREKAAEVLQVADSF